MNLSTAQILRNALVENKVEKADLNLPLIRQHLADLTQSNAEIAKRISDPHAGFAFLRLKPVSFAPQVLYGQNVSSDTALELSACSALKNAEGKWVPNENDILFKSLITERGVSDLAFNTQTCDIQPTQFIELNGMPVAKPEPRYTHSEQFGRHFYEEIGKARKALAIAQKEASRLQDSGVKLNKTEKEAIAGAQAQLERYARNGLAFCLEIDSEQAEKDVHHLKMEVLSSVTSHITKVAEQLTLKDTSGLSQIESTIEKVFNTRIRDRSKLIDVATLIERYAPHYKGGAGCSGHRESEARKDIAHRANRYRNKHVLDLYDACELGKGGLKMSRPSTTQMTLFGDARAVQHFFNLSVSFSAEQARHFGEVKTSAAIDFLEFYMTDYQMMELMRGSLAGDWVHATLARYCGQSVDFYRAAEEDDDHDEVKVEIPDLPDSSQQLLALVVALGTLVDSKSQSKKVRDDMVAVVNAIDELLESEINARDELYLETRAEMLTKYQDSVLPQMERVLERVGQLHPQLKTTLKQRLLSKIGD